MTNRRTGVTYSRLVMVFFLVGLSTVAYLGMVYLYQTSGTLRALQTPTTIALYLLAFIAYVGVLILFELEKRMSVALIWGPAILFRLILLLTHPTLSDDVYRYLWDGHVVNQGISPYAYAINAPELDFLAVPVRALVNHPWMASPYLPVAQGLFAAVTRGLPLQPLSMQATMAAIDLLNGFVIARILVLASLPRRRVLIYLWHPLAVLEVAHGAHVDAWMILLMLMSIWLALSQLGKEETADRYGRFKALAAPVFLALATLTKPLPVLLLPTLFWRWRWRYLLAYFITLLIFLLPSAFQAGWGLNGELDGQGVFGALRIYGEQWRFNSGLFHWTDRLFSALQLVPADRWAKALIGTAMLFVLVGVGWVARYRQAGRRMLRLMAVPLMAYVLLTPTLHPWYLLIVIVFLPFLAPADGETSGRWWLLSPWLYLSAAIIISYMTYIDPLDFREYEWVRLLEWLPTLVLLIYSGIYYLRHEKESLDKNQVPGV